MVIIVEGFDNSGKTSLVQKLQRYLPEHRTIHSPGPKGASLHFWVATQLREMAENPRVIYDRFPLISDMVFGPILRDEVVFSPEQWYGYWKELLKHDPFIVYTRPATNFIMDSLLQREQMDGVVRKAPALLEAYDNLFRDLPTRSPLLFGDHEAYLYRYDYTQDREAERLIKVVKAFGDQLGTVE